VLRLLRASSRIAPRKLAVCVGAVCLLAAGGGLAVAALDASTPPDKATALQRLASVARTDSSTEPAAPPEGSPDPIPARMLGSEVPVPVSPALLRERNGWLVSDGTTLVAVYAGAAGDDPSVGRVVIVRQDLVAGRQTVRTIDAGATGALTIAAAPLGSSVETSAQTASIRLRAGDGRVLALDLGTNALGSG
jgi:hypothetical protein